MKLRAIAALLVFWASVGSAWYSLNALPPESSLPGSSLPGKTPQGKPVQAGLQLLPSESQLPNSVLVAASSDPHSKTSTEQVRKLPSEGELPVATAQDAASQPGAIAQPGKPPDILAPLRLQLQGSRDERIRLRLSAPEHTSSIWTLAFDPSSTHLFTGGDDKVVHHWRLTELPGRNSKNWVHEETIRWQVGSGQVGRVRALACVGTVVCIAGYGAEGTRGEILRYDWAQRVWLEPWVDHTRPIVKLQALNGDKVMAVDEYLGVSLRVGPGPIQWLQQPMKKRPDYWPVTARSDGADVEWFSAGKGNAAPWSVLAKGTRPGVQDRNVEPIVDAGRDQSVFRSLSESLRSQDPAWAAANNPAKLQEEYARWKKNFGPELTLTAVSPDGRLLASVDRELREETSKRAGHWLYVWRDGKLITKTFPFAAKTSNGNWNYRNLAWSADGKKLAVLLVEYVNGFPVRSAVELWSFDSDAISVRLAPRPDEYFECQFSVDNKWLAMAGRSAIRLVSLDAVSDEPLRLPVQTNLLPLRDVSFANAGYVWKAAHGTGNFAFDSERMALVNSNRYQWQPTLDRAKGWQSGEWRIQFKANKYEVVRGQTILGSIDPISETDPLNVTAANWIRGAGNLPVALAVVYDKFRENEIHIFSLAPSPGGRLNRIAVFTGHEGKVESLSVSADQRILLSSGGDRLVCNWPLFALTKADTQNSRSWQKYGAIFGLDAGQLSVSEIDPAGPLYEFGLRQGDEIVGLDWFAAAEDGITAVAQNVPTNQQAIDFLNKPDFDTIVRFTYQSPGTDKRQVQLKPHWRPLFTQAFSIQREWAAWTAPGFYASSFNGNTLFGWQINRGIKSPPDFFRADRFQAVLEQPEILKRILSSGSVQAAAAALGQRVSSNFDPLTNAVTLQPLVKITTPTNTDKAGDDSQIIEASIQLPRGSEIASLKAYANGVPAVLKTQREEANPFNNGKVNYIATWRSGLPRDTDVKFQVAIASSEKLVGTDEVIVHRKQLPTEKRRPRLWLFAGGVNNYDDKQIPALKTPENNVDSVAGWIESATNGLYDCQLPLTLKGSHMTRGNWLAIVRDKLDELQYSVHPDDVVIIFLSGHGLQDPESGKYFYVPANASFDDVRSGVMDQCLGVNEIAPFAGLACRKIVILDTCHSGVQDLAADRLKAAVRALQADLVLTLTASEGDEKAAEENGKANSVFTEVLGTALNFPNDRDGDRLLIWPEFVKQVQDGVIEKSRTLLKAEGLFQTPTVVPSELLPYIRLPLTKTPLTKTPLTKTPPAK